MMVRVELAAWMGSEGRGQLNRFIVNGFVVEGALLCSFHARCGFLGMRSVSYIIASPHTVAACVCAEASPSFVDMIDQTSLGHRLLLSQFGPVHGVPRTTWQIDPFGHSAFQGSMMSAPLAGYSAVYFARADWQEIPQRNANKTTEMFWAPSASQGASTGTLGGILYNGYGPPDGFDMAEWSSDAPVMDDETLEEYNVPQIIEAFVGAATDQLSKYPGNDIMFTMVRKLCPRRLTWLGVFLSFFRPSRFGYAPPFFGPGLFGYYLNPLALCCRGATSITKTPIPGSQTSTSEFGRHRMHRAFSRLGGLCVRRKRTVLLLFYSLQLFLPP